MTKRYSDVIPAHYCYVLSIIIISVHFSIILILLVSSFLRINPTVVTTLMSTMMIEPTYNGWNVHYFRSQHASQICSRTVRLKGANEFPRAKSQYRLHRGMEAPYNFLKQNWFWPQVKGKEQKRSTLEIAHLTLPHGFPPPAV